jgi:hypothetical protein
MADLLYVLLTSYPGPYIERERYPALLRKSNRGKFHDPSAVPQRYGETEAATGVAGVSLLDAYEQGKLRLDDDGTLAAFISIDVSELSF